MWVPPGEWILWQTGESHSGPQTINVQAKQTDIPVLVKAGAVLPLKTMASVSDIAPDPLVLQVLGCGSSASVCDGAGSVYEDDGVSVGYTQSEYRLARVTQNSSGTTTTVTITPRAEGGGYTGEPTRRAYQLELLTGAIGEECNLSGEKYEGVLVRLREVQIKTEPDRYGLRSTPRPTVKGLDSMVHRSSLIC